MNHLTLRVMMLIVKILARILATVSEQDYRDMTDEISCTMRSLSEEIQATRYSKETK